MTVDPDARYRRLGPLTGNEASIYRPDTDGAPIQVVDIARGTTVFKAVCRPQFSPLTTEFRYYSLSSSLNGLLSWSDEGITWIRGHHAPDSKEVAALLVAYALGRAA